MRITSIVSITTLVITVLGIFVWFGQFVGTTNTSLKYVEEKVTVVASDVKDIKNMLISGNIKKETTVAKGN